MKIAVIGSGGWGTALALLLHSNGHDITLWSYSKEESDNLRNTLENPFLKGVPIPADLYFTSDPACVAGQQAVVMATPSFAVRNTARMVAPYLEPDVLLVSVTKGIEAKTGKRMSEIIAEETSKAVTALSGPSHAEEVGRGIPTGVVAACPDASMSHRVQDIFMNERFRVYTSPDIVGVELSGALKNVIALCAGVCDGMNFGDNTKALMMTRGLTEVARLGMALGSRHETFAGLAGVGDLIVTCTSMHSRNHRAGILIGQGKDVETAMREVGSVVEGYYAAQSAKMLAEKVGVEMPIMTATYQVLYEGRDVNEAVHELLRRKKTHEIEDAGWVKA